MNGVLIYITRDGDRWDTISHKHYGTVFEIDRLIATNPHLPLAEQKMNNQQEDMPPWLR